MNGTEKITVISDEGLIPSSYVRLINVFERCGANYRYVSSGNASSKDVLMSKIVIFQRCHSNKALQFLYVGLKNKKIIIYEMDDYLLDLPKSSSVKVSKRNVLFFLKYATVVTCSTNRLRNELLNYNRNIKGIPNRVNISYERKREFSNQGIRIFLSNTDYFKLIESDKSFYDAIKDIIIEYPSVKFIVMGSIPEQLARLKDANPNSVMLIEEFIPNYNEYIKFLQGLNIDIALVPLEKSYFHSFKSNIKYLDYAAIGIPGIFSNVDVFNETVADKKNGILVNNTYEGWYYGIKRLIDNIELRNEIGRNACEDVCNNYNLEKSAKEWKELIFSFNNGYKEDRNLFLLALYCKILSLLKIAKKSIHKMRQGLLKVIGENSLYSDSNGKVYVIEKGEKRHICRPDIFDSYGYEWNRVKKSKFIVNLIPTGPTIAFAKESFRSSKRDFLAKEYIRGKGIEIGALHNPLKVPSNVLVKYVDYLSYDQLKNHYPEINGERIQAPDIIDNGEELVKIEDQSQDFVIANHYVEHCRNPIKAISNMLRVLKNGGILYMAIPDKRYTFDIDRPVSPIQHILKDYAEGHEWSRAEHYEDWLRNKEKFDDEGKIKEQISKYINNNFDIHFHVWTQAEMLEMVAMLKKELKFPFELELCAQNMGGFENIFILKKI